MALKAILEKLEEVPEALREHYQQAEDGKFVLTFTDDHPVRRKAFEALGEKKKAEAQRDEILKRFEGIDPEDHKRLRQEMEEVRSGKGETIGKILATEQKRLQDEYGQKLSRTSKERDEVKAQAEKYRTKVSHTVLANRIREVLERERIKLSGPGAFNDLVSRASDAWEADPDSNTIQHRQKDAFGDPPSASEWIRGLLRDPLHSHLFEGSQGGGAGGSGRRLGNGKVLLSQAELEKPSPEQFKAIQEGNYEVRD